MRGLSRGSPACLLTPTGEPNRKGKVTYEFWSGEQIVCEFPVEAEWVPGFDQFIAAPPALPPPPPVS